MNRRNYLRTLPLATSLTAGCSVPRLASGKQAAWRFEGGSDSSTALVRADDSVFVGIQQNVYKIGAASGQQEWVFEGDHQFLYDLDVASENVFVAGVDGSVVALDAASGARQWATEPLANDPVTGITSHDATGILYATVANGVVAALDPASGTEHWRYQTEGDVLDGPAADANSVYVASRDTHVYALDAKTGEERWALDTGTEPFGTPTVANGTVYPGNFAGSLQAIDTESGTERWRYETRREESSPPTIADGIAYVSTSGGTLHAVDLETRSAIWTYGGYGGSPSPPGVGPDHVYVGDEDRLAAVSKSTGKSVWKMKIGTNWHLTPIVDTDRVYTANGEGVVHAIPRT